MMPTAPWSLVAQCSGVGRLATSADSADVTALAARVAATGASLTILRGESPLKEQVNAAALVGAIGLMKRVKQQFDPAAVLNAGVLGGGI
jgi:phage tail sheath gpL-like